jgi:hypothetical protein
MEAEQITNQVRREREGIEDQGRSELWFLSEAAFTVAIAKLLWIYTFSLGFAILSITLGFALRMIILWKIAMYTQNLSPLDLSLLVGSDIGAISAISFLILLIPRMIITWTTALIFEFVFDRKLQRDQKMIENGKKMAREISITMISNALQGGEIAGFVASVATLIGLTLLRWNVGGECLRNPI